MVLVLTYTDSTNTAEFLRITRCFFKVLQKIFFFCFSCFFDLFFSGCCKILIILGVFTFCKRENWLVQFQNYCAFLFRKENFPHDIVFSEQLYIFFYFLPFFQLFQIYFYEGPRVGISLPEADLLMILKKKKSEIKTIF